MATVDYRKRNHGAKRSFDPEELHSGPNKRAELNHALETQASDIDIIDGAAVLGGNASLPDCNVISQTFEDTDLQAFAMDFDPFCSDFAFYLDMEGIQEPSEDFLSANLGRVNFSLQDGGTAFSTSQNSIARNSREIVA